MKKKFFSSIWNILPVIVFAQTNSMNLQADYLQEQKQKLRIDSNEKGITLLEDLNLKGNYKNGIPYGTWIAYYPFNVPRFVYVYNNKNYIGNIYYPDGTQEQYWEGNFTVDNETVYHKQTYCQQWAPTGEEIRSINARFNNEQKGWQWGEKEKTISVQKRSYTIINITIEFIWFIVDDNFLVLGIYSYSDHTFLGKIIKKYQLLHNTGELKLLTIKQYGSWNNFSPQYTIREESKDSDYEKYIVFDLQIPTEIENKVIKTFTLPMRFGIEKKN